ncbi:glycosyltransferase [Streptomyces sp. NPDC054961]
MEAGLHGVATIGSCRGGIPEAAGDGGVVLHPDDVDAWVKAIGGRGRTPTARSR